MREGARSVCLREGHDPCACAHGMTGLGISSHAGGARSVCLHACDGGLGISRHARGARSVCLHAWNEGLGIRALQGPLKGRLRGFRV